MAAKFLYTECDDAHFALAASIEMNHKAKSTDVSHPVEVRSVEVARKRAISPLGLVRVSVEGFHVQSAS